MPRRTKLRPLTDAEERCLIALAGRPTDWFKPCRNDTTLWALREAGLVRVQIRPMCAVGQITESGIAMCNSMGD